jgi:hypothetical protein
MMVHFLFSSIRKDYMFKSSNSSRHACPKKLIDAQPMPRTECEIFVENAKIKICVSFCNGFGIYLGQPREASTSPFTPHGRGNKFNYAIQSRILWNLKKFYMWRQTRQFFVGHTHHCSWRMLKGMQTMRCTVLEGLAQN